MGRTFIAAGALLLLAGTGTLPAKAAIVVEYDGPMRFLANPIDPGLGLSWVQPGFDDSAWTAGSFGVGYETSTGGSRADVLIESEVAPGAFSIYARATFEIADAGAVQNLFLGADYDDGFVAWINGTLVHCSAEMPTCAPAWNTSSGLHESSNAPTPDLAPLHDVSAVGIPVLNDGVNVLAIGVWNGSGTSSDLVLAPRLIVDRPSVDVVRGPYLQMLTDTRVTVRWRTATPTESRVRYGAFPDDLTLTAGSGALATEHAVTLTGLTPNTEYCYSVGRDGEVLAGDDFQHFFWTAPPVGTRQPVRIWAIGDSGTGNADAGEVRRAFERYDGVYTDLWLMLGDNAYPDGTDDEYQDAVFDTYPRQLRTSAVWPTIGNHDARNAFSDSLTGPYYDIFDMPTAAESGGLASGTEAYYSFDYANIHFISLNSEDVSRSTGGTMASWLEQDLAATTQDWIVAFWHHPPYTKGSHDSDDPGDSGGRMFDMRENVLPILEDWGVDLVLSGHSHSYERSLLLDGHYGVSSTLDTSMVLDGGDGRRAGDGVYQKFSGAAGREGAVYVVAGSSGKLSSGTLDHPAMAVSVMELGSLVLDVFGDRMDVAFLRDDEVVRDVFSLVKNVGTPPFADFDASVLTGPAPLEVEFYDLSSTNVTGWSWDLDGDGQSDSAEIDPGAVYQQPGAYSVGLTVSNQGGVDEELKSAYICVSGADPAPVAGLALAADRATLAWSGGALATSYDVVRADLGALRDGGGLSGLDLDCVSQGSATDAVDADVPAVGQGFAYLVRGVSCAGELGSYDSGGEGQSAPRDPAPGVCP